jgi:hypothetical protein
MLTCNGMHHHIARLQHIDLAAILSLMLSDMRRTLASWHWKAYLGGRTALQPLALTSA